MWARRDFIRLGLLSGAAFACGGPRSRLKPSIASNGSSAGDVVIPRVRPTRYNLHIFLRGGIDAAYTSDPKSRADVEPWIDVPISPNEMFEVNGYPFGPHLLPLKDFLDRFAIVNNVVTATANHDTGTHQFLRMRTRVSPLMPSILDIIGEHRDGQPLATLSLGAMDPREYSGGRFGGSIILANTRDVLDELLNADPAELALLARVQRQEADELARTAAPGDAAYQTAINLRESADVIDRLQKIPAPQSETWSEIKGEQRLAQALQRALWAIENDLVACVYLRPPFNWDSHLLNAKNQTTSSGGTFSMLAKFLHELDRRSNQWGRLSDNITMVMGSELGRFPRLNGLDGKDHFPEAPCFLFGRAFRPGVYGQSGRRMEGLPISFATGRASNAGRLPGIDNLGATWLAAAGANPKLYGYEADVLPFLLEGNDHR